ncbi:tetratricopeptide repeat protein [Eleftheria terrae]|uniref:tetratricopeptide repeat protein n=1 Tax=Eleftheria terrae TaxID=1597781 RepID=UPI00263AB060|nr:tetratricopeptide repeat protein [Eleftheria terrae]WKB53648.1 tetratricopeptide repeat protein [Eleftheria terrae]
MSLSREPAAIRGFTWRLLKWQALLLLSVGATQAARRTFDRLLARHPDDRFALAGRAHLLATHGEPEAAMRDYGELVRLHPEDSAAAWFNLAYLLDEAGRCEEAEAGFRRALALDPRLDRAWYGLGLSLIRMRRLDEAVDALRRNTELQPMSPYGWYQLARVHVDRDEPQEATRIIRHLKGFEPQVAAQLERETGLAA